MNFEFIFRAGGIQSTTKNVQTAYSTIIPGSFFLVLILDIVRRKELLQMMLHQLNIKITTEL